MHGEAVRGAQQLGAQLAQAFGGHRRLHFGGGGAVELVFAGATTPTAVLGGGGDLRLQTLVQRGEVVPHALGELVDLLLGHHAFGDQALGPQFRDALVRLDLCVHLRLGVGGLVGLVVAEAAVPDQVDQHVVAEFLAEGEGEAHGAHAGGDVVGVDVDDRHVEALRQIGGPPRGARVVGVGGEADLVVGDQVHGAADLVAVERLQVERLGDDALGGEGGVAVDRDRHRGVGVLVGVGPLARGLGGAGGALDDGRDVLQVGGVGLEVDLDRLAVGQQVGAVGAVVVLDVARAALGDRGDGLERGGPLELGEDRVVGAPEVVREHVEAPAVGHPDHDLLAAVGGGQLDQLVEHRHGHVEALDRELVLAEVGLVHEALQRVHLDEALEQRLLLVVGQRLAERAGLDLLAQPHALAVGGDVLDLVGDRAAVGLAQVRQRVGERRPGHPHAQDLGGDLRHQFGREAERLGVQGGVALGLDAERVQARGEVAVGAECLQQRGGRLHGLQQLFVGRGARRAAAARLLDRGRGRRGSGRRRGHRRRGTELDAERGEHAVVEAELALQVLLDPREEAPGLCALDHAVVVGGGHRHDLLRADHRADLAESHGVADRAGGDDRALAVHQPWHRGDGAEAAGVGERDVGALQVVGGERVGARLLHQRVVGGEEALERQVGGVGDHRHHQRAGAVLLLDVHREAEVDLAVEHAVGLAVDLREVVGHHRHVGGGARDRVGDQMGERHLAPRRLQLAPAGVEGGDGERAEAGGGGDRARLLHVAGQCGGTALHQFGARRCGRPRHCRRRRRARRP